MTTPSACSPCCLIAAFNGSATSTGWTTVDFPGPSCIVNCQRLPGLLVAHAVISKMCAGVTRSRLASTPTAGKNCSGSQGQRKTVTAGTLGAEKRHSALLQEKKQKRKQRAALLAPVCRASPPLSVPTVAESVTQELGCSATVTAAAKTIPRCIPSLIFDGWMPTLEINKMIACWCLCEAAICL